MNISNNLVEIWLPALTFSNAEDNIDVLSDPSLTVQIMRQGLPTMRDKLFINEERVYNGNENDIILLGEYENYFKCTYDLLHYPFDTQKCWIELKVPITLNNTLKIAMGTSKYNGPAKLVQFNVKGVHLQLLNNGTTIRCMIKFKRNPLYHITTTYLPTSCILFMALVTLYIDESHFEATIMVSLTSMLVMYTLFQSISTSMPNTAYLKFLDYWLIFGLSMPFFIFTSEVSLELVKQVTSKRL